MIAPKYAKAVCQLDHREKWTYIAMQIYII